MVRLRLVAVGVASAAEERGKPKVIHAEYRTIIIKRRGEVHCCSRLIYGVIEVIVRGLGCRNPNYIPSRQTDAIRTIYVGLRRGVSRLVAARDALLTF